MCIMIQLFELENHKHGNPKQKKKIYIYIDLMRDQSLVVKTQFDKKTFTKCVFHVIFESTAKPIHSN